MIHFIASLSVVSALFFSTAVLAHSSRGDEAVTSAKDSIYQIPSKWQDQNGTDWNLKSLRGHPVILAMAYTRCQYSCPLIVENMKKLEMDLAAKGAKDVAFTLFSFDAKHDTSEKLKKFAETRHLDLTHWTLFHGSANAVRDLAAVLGIRYKETSQGEFDHSNIIFLLDPEGIVRFQQTGLNKDAETFEKNVLELLIRKP